MNPPEPMTMPVPMQLEPPPAGQGVQLRMRSTIAAGQEIERCQFVKAPPEGLNITRDEVRYTAGSHHVLLWKTSYSAIPTEDSHGMLRDTSGVVDCASGATADWQVTTVIGGAQSYNGGSLVSLPSDVAIKVPGNAVLLINTHYLNASQKELDAEARINLYTIPDSQVKQEGGILFFYNPYIRVPANGQAGARMRCGIGKDITLDNIQSHMHRRGVSSFAELRDATTRPIETLYTNTDWGNVPVKEWKPGKSIHSGSFIEYECDYKNDESRVVMQGPSTRDEMCMLIGSYYPRDELTEMCANYLLVGTGTRSCGDTLKCATDAYQRGDVAALYACIQESCPSAVNELYTALQCIGNLTVTCSNDCVDPASLACTTCKQTTCQIPAESCQKATCN